MSRLYPMAATGQNPADSATYYGYHVWDEASVPCITSFPASSFTPYSTSWMGDSVQITDTSTVFYNDIGGKIHFPKGLRQGLGWTLYITPSGVRFEGFVPFVSFEQLGNTQDSVATIEIRAYNASGQPILSPLDTILIELSQNHGFVKSLSWGQFPDAFDAFHRTDRETLTGTMVYDLEIGDIYQTRTDQGMSSTDAEYRVFAKSFSTNQDSLFYGIEKVSFTYIPDPQSPIVQIDTFRPAFSLSELSLPIDSLYPEQSFALISGLGDPEIRHYSEEYGGLGV
ncbi:MAG: hypothetical protein AAF206_31550, partial [Bacteroidota bacterium]